MDNVEQFEINGLGGDDTLTVQDLTGTDVQQVIFNGGDGNDSLDASLSNVAIWANGGDGEDTLIGGNGNDTLEGGNGNNTFTGGGGADVFIVGFDGIDVINDFNSAEGDILQLSMTEFGASSPEDFEYSSITGNLYFQGNQFAVINTPTTFGIASGGSGFNPGEDIEFV